MLEARGYLQGWSLTATGEMLAGLYHEADLLIAESLRLGLLDGLEPAALAAVTSSFCFESRRDREGSVDTPHGAVAERLQALEELSFELAGEEQERGLPVMRGIDPGFAALARDWARGRELAQVLSRPKVKAQPKGAVRPRPAGRGPGGRAGRPLMTGGDFVRNVKQLIDLLGQLAVVAPAAETRASASAASRRLRRGVVAASSEVHVPAAGETIHAQSREAP
jgi:ATP-dependent RNA helicase HelY